MSVTRLQNVFRMRDLLDNAYPNKPSLHQLFRQEISEEQDIVNETNNTGKPWATAEYQFNYTTNQSKYPINVSNFGKVLNVLKVTGNPYVPFVPVPFDDIAEQTYGRIMMDFYGVYGSIFPISETPEHMSFYRSGVMNSQYMVEIQPMPSSNWTYIVTYLPGYLGVDDPLSAAIQMPEHAELVRLRGATALLNYSSWYEDEQQNRQKREDLAKGFAYQLDRKEALFSKYIRNINIPRMVDVGHWSD